MAKVVITGAEEIRRNLKAAQDEIKKGVLKGMVLAARVIQRDVEIEGDPTVPIDIRNLSASFFISSIIGSRTGEKPRFRKTDPKTGHSLSASEFSVLQTSHAAAVATADVNVRTAKNLTVILGYGANYAIWVHEMQGDVKWSKEGTGPKWFEKSIKRNKNVMLKYIGESAMISSLKHYPTTRTKTAHTDRTDVDDINTDVFL